MFFLTSRVFFKPFSISEVYCCKAIGLNNTNFTSPPQFIPSCTGAGAWGGLIFKHMKRARQINFDTQGDVYVRVLPSSRDKLSDN